MLEITKPTIEHDEVAGTSIVADRYLALTADGRTLVDETHVDAKVLFAAPGHMISAADVKRLNLSLVDGKVVQDAEAAAAPAKKKGAKGRAKDESTDDEE